VREGGRECRSTMSMSDRLPFSDDGQLLFLGRLARQHTGRRYEVLVLSRGGFQDATVEEAKALLARVLRCGWQGDAHLPPLLTRRLQRAFKTFMFSGKAEMGRDFYVKIVNADKEVRVPREMLVMARCKGMAPLHQVCMARVASCLGSVGEVNRVALRELEIPLHLKDELETFL